MCPGLRVAWVQISLRMARCPPSRPAHTTKSPPTTTTTTTTCSSTPSAPPQTQPPSSPPRAARPATDPPAITAPPPPPTTATTTIPPCHVDSPSPLRPAPMGAPYQDQSATPSCPRLRRCRRHTASLSCSSRPLPPHHRCPPPQSQPPTSPEWEECPSWCLHRIMLDLWSNVCQHWQNSADDINSEILSLYTLKKGQLLILFKGNYVIFSKDLQ